MKAGIPCGYPFFMAFAVSEDLDGVRSHVGSLLYDLLTGVELPRIEGKTEDVLRLILERVSCQANVDFRPYKTSTILRRIGRRMAVTHRLTMREYADYLEAHPEEVGEHPSAFV